MKLHTINSGYFKLDGGAMHGVVPKTMWQKANPADETNMCTWAMRCLLIEHGNYRILIDCGMGTKQDEKFFGYYHPHGSDSVEKNLKAAGYEMEDITDVFLTHLHFDHCGGAMKKDENGNIVPAFPKAVYWTNKAHWETATNPNIREAASFLKENILPIEEQNLLRYAEMPDGGAWLDDINVKLVRGHTEAMMLPLINYNGRTILFCADLIPSAAHISLPWVMAYDMRPVDTLTEKEQILNQAAENNWILFLEHDPKIECCRVMKTEKGIRIKETFALAEMANFPG